MLSRQEMVAIRLVGSKAMTLSQGQCQLCTCVSISYTYALRSCQMNGHNILEQSLSEPHKDEFAINFNLYFIRAINHLMLRFTQYRHIKELMM